MYRVRENANGSEDKGQLYIIQVTMMDVFITRYRKYICSTAIPMEQYLHEHIKMVTG